MPKDTFSMTSLPDALTIDDLHRAYADGMTAAEVIEQIRPLSSGKK